MCARVREGPVRRAMSELGDWSPPVRADRLTWGVGTSLITVQEVRLEAPRASEEVAEIRRATPGDGAGAPGQTCSALDFGLSSALASIIAPFGDLAFGA